MYGGNAGTQHAAGDLLDDAPGRTCRPAARSRSSAAASDPNGDPIRYNLMYSTKYVNGGTGLH